MKNTIQYSKNDIINIFKEITIFPKAYEILPLCNNSDWKCILFFHFFSKGFPLSKTIKITGIKISRGLMTYYKNKMFSLYNYNIDFRNKVNNYLND
jgi:hypothetical protein